MNAFKITGQKDFMNRLLGGTLFEEFDLKEATVRTAVSWHLDGHLNQEYFPTECEKNYIAFQDVKPVLFQMIKGKIPPVSFHMVLHLNQEEVEKIEAVSAESFKEQMIQNLVLNIKFENGVMQLITAIDYENFTLDKSYEKEWDHWVYALLSSSGLAFS